LRIYLLLDNLLENLYRHSYDFGTSCGRVAADDMEESWTGHWTLGRLGRLGAGSGKGLVGAADMMRVGFSEHVGS
jgi:hypothetical protein